MTNTGSRAGAEVVQFYVGDPVAAVRRPVRELKAFEKLRLEPGQARRVSVRLTSRDFAFFDIGAGTWRREAGEYVIEAGASSVDIRSRATVRLAADPAVPPLIDDETLGGRRA